MCLFNLCLFEPVVGIRDLPETIIKPLAELCKAMIKHVSVSCEMLNYESCRVGEESAVIYAKCIGSLAKTDCADI